jgi:ABC-type multidrug transport system permease subunit
MSELVEFVLGSFWHWLGLLILVAPAFVGLESLIGTVVSGRRK